MQLLRLPFWAAARPHLVGRGSEGLSLGRALVVEGATAWVLEQKLSLKNSSPDILVLDWAGSGYPRWLPRSPGAEGAVEELSNPRSLLKSRKRLRGLLLLLCVQGQHGLGQAHWAVGVWGRIRGYCGG